MSLSRLRETVKDREAWRAAVHGVTESDMTELLNNCQELLLHPERACSVTNRLQLPGGSSRRHRCSWWREAKRKGTPVEVLPRLERRTRGNEQTNFLCLFHRAGPVPGLLQKLLSAHKKTSDLLLYSTGNYTQISVITYMGKEYENEKERLYIYMCVCVCVCVYVHN